MDEFIQRAPAFYQSDTIVLLRESTNILKLLNPNADSIVLGDATHEGGDIKVYRDASNNLAFSLDADAASNVKALDVYGGVVCQNYLTVGQTSLNTGANLFVNGSFQASNIYTNGIYFGSETKTISGANNSYLTFDVPVTSGTAVSYHNFKIDENSILKIQATGDNAGGITDKAIGLYGTTPTTQAVHIADPAESIAGNNAAIDAILVALENIGILASS